MIGFLTGTASVTPSGDIILMTTGGVGYLVAVTPAVLASIAATPDCQLHIYTHVREETIELYGFLTHDEKRLFKLLLDISGVGPKLAMAIAGIGADAIIKAVQLSDVAAFSVIPRVGKKMAQKIIIELKPKLGSLTELQLGLQDPAQEDVYAALISLGYEEQLVLRTMREHDTSEMTTPAAITYVIRKLSSS